MRIKISKKDLKDEKVYGSYGEYESHKELTLNQYIFFKELIFCKSFYYPDEDCTYAAALKNQTICIDSVQYHGRMPRYKAMEWLIIIIQMKLLVASKDAPTLYIINPAYSLLLNENQYKFANDIIAKEFGV